MSTGRRVLRGLFYAWVVLTFGAVVLALYGWSQGRLATTENAIGIVEVDGVIEDGDDVVEILDKLAEEERVHAVVLRVNSPGGAVAPSQEIYDAVFRVREKKPVVASFSGMATSGGYYVASACDAIVSNPGTLTGSIGVIMQLGNLEELLEKVGLSSFVLKAGKYKDMGSALRPMREDERALLETLLENIHGQFIEAIARGRGMTVDQVRALADGRIYSGEQAFEVGLVDRLGGLHDAIALAAEKAGIEGKPEAVPYEVPRKPWWWRELSGAFAGDGGEIFGLRFLYLGPRVAG